MDMACEETVVPMTVIGFEGFEKWLEIEFFVFLFYIELKGRGLRVFIWV